MDVSTLPADTARRYRAVAELLLHHGKTIDHANPALLDVGGYPGTFARAFVASWPRWHATTLDQVADNLPDYVTGSGARIPFEDSSFSAVSSIDTLEHIPADKRADFLQELCRVSSDLVVLAAPFYHPSVAAAEKILAGAHEKAFRSPHPWLDEHVRFGLPQIDQVVAQWPASHAVVEVVSSYDLGEWVTWQALSLINKLRGETDNVWKGLDQAWAAVPAPPPISVPYRWVIVARRGGRPQDYRGVLSLPDELGQEHVETARFFGRMIEMMAGDSSRAAQNDGALILEDRLRAAIVANEQEITRMKGGEGNRAPDSPSAMQRVSSMMKRFGR
ncbi:methyltransferase domain-containing protein [bacterium]|nr:methyltransferase domain-containing protein [bacterium]